MVRLLGTVISAPPTNATTFQWHSDMGQIFCSQVLISISGDEWSSEVDIWSYIVCHSRWRLCGGIEKPGRYYGISTPATYVTTSQRHLAMWRDFWFSYFWCPFSQVVNGMLRLIQFHHFPMVIDWNICRDVGLVCQDSCGTTILAFSIVNSSGECSTWSFEIDGLGCSMCEKLIPLDGEHVKLKLCFCAVYRIVS